MSSNKQAFCVGLVRELGFAQTRVGCFAAPPNFACKLTHYTDKRAKKKKRADGGENFRPFNAISGGKPLLKSFQNLLKRFQGVLKRFRNVPKWFWGVPK